MTANEFDPEHKDVRRHAVSGFVYTGVAQATRIVTQFVSVLIMARLLNAADFGLVAKVSPIYFFALLFHDLGLSQATVQRPDLTTQQVNSFFWINSGLGGAIALVIMLCSPLIGWFYQDGRAAYLSVAMALLILVSGLSNQHGALMQRKMVFRNQAIVSILGSVGGLAAAIAWGLLFHDYWAIFVGMAAGTILPAIGVWFLVDWKPGLPKVGADIVSMLRYGLGIAGGNLINFAVTNLSSVVMGRAFGDHQLGMYDRSGRLLNIPLQQLIYPIAGVIVPILYRLHDDDARYRETFLRTLTSISFAVVPGTIWVILMSTDVIHIFLGAKWVEAAPVFAVLSFASLPILINGCANWLIITQGRSRDYAKWGIFSGLFSLLGLFGGLKYGILGVAIGTAAVQIFLSPLYWWFACRRGPVSALQSFRAMLPVFVASIICVPALLRLRDSWGAGYRLELLICGTIITYVLSLILICFFPQGRAAITKDVQLAFYILKGLNSQQQSRAILTDES